MHREARWPSGVMNVVLRRVHRAADQLAGLRVGHEEIEIELGGFTHDGPGPLQVLRVAAEGIVFPEMLAQPSAGRREQAPARMLAGRGEAEDVADRVHGPAVGAVVHPRRSAAAGSKRVDQIKQRLVALRQIADLGRPVIHLHVDVRMIVAVPGHLEAVRPKPLQVRRQAARPGAADEQVAAELEVQAVNSGSAASVMHGFEPLVRRYSLADAGVSSRPGRDSRGERASGSLPRALSAGPRTSGSPLPASLAAVTCSG